MGRNGLSLALVLFMFIESVTNKINHQKMCIVVDQCKKSSIDENHSSIWKMPEKSPVSCICKEDRLSCLMAVSQGEADFGIFEPEDLYLSTLSEQSSVLVVSEIRELKKEPYAYGFVVLVRTDSHISRVEDLRGKRLCHPGIESGPEWNFLFGQYFEERVAPENCNEGISVYENRIKATSEFFAEACKAGPWVSNPEEDARLKTKYSNLCSLCDSGDCSERDKYRGSGGSLVCLRDGIGEILWAKSEDVKIHLKFLEEESLDSYHYLCDDGEKMPLSSKEPCIWLAKPWRVIVANRKSAMDVQKLMEMLTNGLNWPKCLMYNMDAFVNYIRNLPVSLTPEDYLRKIPGYLSASVMAEGTCKPRRTLRLCVTSILELEKCKKMSKAAPALAIQPFLECVQKNHTVTCLDSVAKKETDAVVVPVDFLYVATRKFHLRTFLQETGKKLNDSYLVSFVVKKNSGMKKLEDLKSKKVCFTRKHGIGWNSAVSVVRAESPCEDTEALDRYFGDVCVVDGDDHPRRCCPEMGASWADVDREEVDALRCLQKGGCDVAVVDYNILLQYSDDKSDLDSSEFRAVCRGEKESECHWVWSQPNFLMTSIDANSSRALELENVFFQMGQNFGKRSYQSNIVKIFAPFQQTPNVLFRDSSTSFVFPRNWSYPNNYSQILQRMNVCSKSPRSQTHVLLALTVTFSSLFFMF